MKDEVIQSVLDRGAAIQMNLPDPYTFDEYADEASKTAKMMEAHEGIKFALIGLQGESGEVAEPIKKHFYHGKPLNFDALYEEIGDVMWYLSQLVRHVGTYEMLTQKDSFSAPTMGQIAKNNIKKLRARHGAKTATFNKT